MQWSQSLVVMSFCNVHLYCPVMTVYDKPYNEMILWCWFHTLETFLSSQSTQTCCWLTLLHVIFIISSQFPHIIPTAPSQTSHMHSYTIPTQLDTSKHHSDLPNRLQLDSVPEPYIYPLLEWLSQRHVAVSSVCRPREEEGKNCLCAVLPAGAGVETSC